MPEPIQTSADVKAAVPANLHPMIMVAAAALTLFCAVGIAVLTGIIPGASGQKHESVPPSMPMTPVAATAAMGSASEAALPEPKALDAADNNTLGQPLAKAEKAAAAHPPTVKAHPPASRHTSTAAAEAPTPVYVQSAASGGRNGQDPSPVAAYAPPPCGNCAIVDRIVPIATPGQGRGAGAVLGGVLGGVLGHQVGNGRGKDLATVAGAVGGAVLGNSVEKNRNAANVYDVRVRFTDGTFQTLRYPMQPDVRVGDKVRIENGRAIRS
jgi:hypothetical protein